MRTRELVDSGVGSQSTKLRSFLRGKLDLQLICLLTTLKNGIELHRYCSGCRPEEMFQFSPQTIDISDYNSVSKSLAHNSLSLLNLLSLFFLDAEQTLQFQSTFTVSTKIYLTEQRSNAFKFFFTDMILSSLIFVGASSVEKLRCTYTQMICIGTENRLNQSSTFEFSRWVEFNVLAVHSSSRCPKNERKVKSDN